ncbi:PAS domain S-box protein [Tundrisphaera lichenicola]|uniref:PAS domain S-box protein n=1 Tax=Tundrisphaera lichenicola TaxID=2029860 RepID=UPI003EB8559F
MNETAILADHLDQRIDAILKIWRNTVDRNGDVPGSEKLSTKEFVDHIPELLDRLSERLRGRTAETTPTAQKHGQHRWNQGYEIGEVVTELGHLRSTLMRATFALARSENYDIDWIEATSRAIDEVIDEATAESVQKFEADSKSRSQSILDEFETRKTAAESERIKLETLLNNLPIGVWVAEVDGSVLSLNREAVRLQGFEESETGGWINSSNLANYYHLFHFDGREYQPEEFPIYRALRGETIIQEDVIWPDHTGDRVASIYAAPMAGADGTIVGAVAVAQDISDRKRLEEDLAISDARIRAIVEKSPVMIWRADQSGSRDFFNETWLAFRGRSLSEEAQEGWQEGVHPEDLTRVLETFRLAFERREGYESVYRLQNREGRFCSVTDRGAPYHDTRGTFLGFLGSCLDITDRVELECKLEQQSIHKSRLMSALSHDARTPLNAVVLSAKLLESQVKDQDDPEVQECLRTIRNAVRNVLDLLSDLLDLTRIDAGATRAEASRFALKATLSECLSSILPQAQAKGLAVRLELGDLEDARLETDRAKLKQILSNLLSNALRYTDRGEIRLFAERPSGRIVIGVQDTGVGIAEVDHLKIFDEFAVLEHPQRVLGEGTGLGLAICRRLANLLQGEILLESESGRGSTFILSLPNTVLTTESARAEAPQGEPSRSFDGAILIAEDHVDSRRTLAKVLRRMGYRVLEAGDGREVLELVRQERPMVVLMDVNMPGLDGVETTLALRNDPEFQSLPILALTGDVTILNQQRIGEAGVDGYLEKPVTWERLEAALDQLRIRLNPTSSDLPEAETS